jgi:hypothetical protein
VFVPGKGMQHTYTVVNLDEGDVYLFRIQKITLIDGVSKTWSWSNTVRITPAWRPYAPANVKTSIISNKLMITWTPPFSGGAAIFRYYVEIRNQ